MRLTASALSRAEQCIGSCVLPAIPESGDYAATGQAVDDYIRIAKTTSPAAALAQAPAEHRAYLAALPLDKIPDGAEYQVAFAWSALTGEVRRIPSRQDGYPTDMGPEWVFGSADIVGVRAGRALLWDIKWGAYTIGREPDDDLQLGFLSMCVAKYAHVEETETGFVRAGWDASLTPDTVVLDEWALAAVEERVRGIWRRQQDALHPRGHDAALGAAPADAEELARVPLHVGSHCTYCPARRACPAMMQPVALAIAGNLGELAAETLPALEVLKPRVEALAPEAKGRLVDRVDAAIEYLGLLKKIIRDDAKLEPIPLPSGNLLAEVNWGSSHPSIDPEAEAEMEALKQRLVAEGKIKPKQAAQVREVTRKTYEKRRVR